MYDENTQEYVYETACEIARTVYPGRIGAGLTEDDEAAACGLRDAIVAAVAAYVAANPPA